MRGPDGTGRVILVLGRIFSRVGLATRSLWKNAKFFPDHARYDSLHVALMKNLVGRSNSLCPNNLA
jgi:hypothetical protein